MRIIPDRDQPGEEHAVEVGRSVHPLAASLKVLRPPAYSREAPPSREAHSVDSNHNGKDLQ